MAEMKDSLAMSELHSNRFADDCGAKDTLIGKLEAKLKEQDAQWEKDVAALSVQVSQADNQRRSLEAALQESRDHAEQLSGDMKILREQHVELVDEKGKVQQQLLDARATVDALEKKLQERRQDSNAIEHAQAEKEREIAELNTQIKFYVHEAQVAADETKKWYADKQVLEERLKQEAGKAESLRADLAQEVARSKCLEADVLRLESSAAAGAMQLSHVQSQLTELQAKMSLMTDKLEEERTTRQKTAAELQEAKRLGETLKRDLERESGDMAKLQDKEGKLEVALKKIEAEKAKERGQLDYYKTELKRAADENSLLKVKHDDEILARKKMEKSRDEYLSKYNSTSERLKKETTTAENMTGQVKVLTKSNTVLESDVARLSAQVTKLEGEVKSQTQLRKNSDVSASSLADAQKKLQLEVQKLKDAKSRLEGAEEESRVALAAATAERNSADQRFKKAAAELKELQGMIAKEKVLKSQLNVRVQEAESKIQELEASHTVLHGEKVWKVKESFSHGF